MSRSSGQGLSAFVAICLLVLTIALMLGSQLLISTLYAFFHDLRVGEAARHVQRLPTLALLQVLAMGAVVAIGLKLLDRELPAFEALRLRPVRSGSLALCLLAGVCLQFPLAELANILHHHVFGMDSIEKQLARQAMLEAHGPLEGALVVACIVGLVPVSEEILFRGFFLFGLAERYGRGFALLLSACLFGLLHHDVVPVAYASVAGLLLGMLALSTESTWSSIALHAAINAVPVLLPESLWPIHGFNVPSDTPEHLPAGLVLPCLALGICLLVAVHRIETRSISHE